MKLGHAAWRGHAWMLAALMASPLTLRAADATVASFDAQESAALDAVVRDVCRKDVVLLGESAGHGGGRSIEIKTELMRRLVDRCGFRGVLFETSLYETIAENRLATKAESSPERFTDAMGQIWFWASEAVPLRDWLYRQRAAGRVRVGGIDVQPGGITARYAMQRLGQDLADALPQSKRADCQAAWDRHHRWGYDDVHPYDDAAKRALGACTDALLAATARKRASDPLRLMAQSYARYRDILDTGKFAAREQGMFEALQWHRRDWPAGTRVIVWTASTHAAKQAARAGGAPPLGAYVHAHFGNKAASVGVVALSGAVGPMGGRGQPTPIAQATDDSLESRALASGAPMRYLDRNALRGFGEVPGRVFHYPDVQRAQWSTLLDGVLVLREERPIIPVKR